MNGPALMMSGNTDGAYTNALAAGLTQMNKSIEQPYVPDNALLTKADNDPGDFDMTKNEIEGTMIAPINTTNPFCYINTTAGTWHPYHDANISKKEIYQSLLLATNTSGTGTNLKDLEILRRVVKQAPIMKAYNQLFWVTLISIIGTILIIYLTVACNIHWGYGVAFGFFSIACLLNAAYNIIWGGKAEGIIKWKDVKNDIANVSGLNKSIIELANLLCGEDKQGKPINPPPVHQQSSMDGALAGAAAGAAVNGLFKVFSS